MNDDKGLWYVERWYDEDLESALVAAGVPVTPENIKAMRESCKGIFDDKTDRNEMLRDKAEELIANQMTPEEVIRQLENLKDNSLSFLEKDELDSVWHLDIKALDQAIVYSGKEIAKAVIPDGDDDMDYLRCPFCHAAVGLSDDHRDDRQKRCGDCGQKLSY